MEQVEKTIRKEEALRRRMESDLKTAAEDREVPRAVNSVKTNDQYHALQHEIAMPSRDRK